MGEQGITASRRYSDVILRRARRNHRAPLQPNQTEVELRRCKPLRNLEARALPLKRMLNDNRTFDPKAVALLLKAFDEIVAALDLRSDADREKAAKIVMRLAHGQTELDAGKIRAEVVRLMRKEGAGRRRAF
jgi:hypothetical protein